MYFNCKNFMVHYSQIHAISSHKKLMVWWMMAWCDIVGSDVEFWHVERNRTMPLSELLLYSCI
jgi:hypothetical protein